MEQTCSGTLNWKKSFNMDNQDVMVCDICTENYDNEQRKPKFMTCHHTFCEYCLNYVAGDQENIECPTCRQVTSLTTGGVRGLQTNFYIIHMKETLDKIGSPKVKGCPKHSNQPMSFFCQKCGLTICRDCTILDHKESDGHSIEDVGVAFRTQRETLQTQADLAKRTQTKMQAKIRQLETLNNNLAIVRDGALADVESTFKKLHGLLDERKKVLTGELQDMYTTRHTNLSSNITAFREQTQILTDSLNTKDIVSQKGCIADIVTLRSKFESSISTLGELTQTLNIGSNFIEFDKQQGLDAFKTNISTIGQYTVDRMLPCRVAIKGPVPALCACLPSEVSIQIYDFKDSVLSKYPIKLLIKDPYKAEVKSTTTMSEDGSVYKAKFTPQMSGTHSIYTVFNGKVIKGCTLTFRVHSNNPVAKFGCFGEEGMGKFNSPRAIGIDEDQTIYVVDTGNKLIQKLKPSGEFASQFTISGPNQEYSTCDLALDAENKVIVCTETLVGPNLVPTMGNSVAIYTLDGRLQHRFCNKVMKCALCIATNAAGDIIVSDYLVHSLFVYDKTGSYIRRICSPSGGFNHPAFISCDSSNNIIVSDTNNDSVQVFGNDGQFLYHFGKTGSGKGELKQPFGVATDGEDILVVDSGNKRIQIFNKEGGFKGMIESKDDVLSQPRGIAITGDGHVLVADRDNHCIKKYRYK